ncbi:cation-independent mannose-6-phosphate receptor-like, partial [Tropilaelaps mercedesae]
MATDRRSDTAAGWGWHTVAAAVDDYSDRRRSSSRNLTAGRNDAGNSSVREKDNDIYRRSAPISMERLFTANRLSIALVLFIQLVSVNSSEQQPASSHAEFCAGSKNGLDGKVLGAYTWVARKPTDQHEVSMIYLSLCEPLNFTRNAGDNSQLHLVGCNGALVCHVTRHRSNNSYVAQVLIKADEGNQPFELKQNYLFLTGGNCSQFFNKKTGVLISFQCGIHLGSPQYMFEVQCETVFRWRTSAACNDNLSNGASGSGTNILAPGSTPSSVVILPKVQVPCYVIDERTGHKYDLSHLTRLRGVHKVEAAKDLYINICQEITDPLIGCTTPGTAACLNLGSSWKSVGLINSSTRVQLIRETGDLIMTYKPSKKAKAFSNCTSEPSTVIHFRCPNKRGRSRPPRLLADISCQYMIEWETDHACPEHAIVGDPLSCKFDIDGNRLDLERLRNPKGLHRVSNVTIFGQQNEVVIDICSHGIGDGGACGVMASTQTANVCFNGSDGNAFILGSKVESHLRYTDGRATLVYLDGNPCRPDSNRKWSSVIEFVCDSEATFGEPELVSVDTDICMIRFEWKTVSACVPDVIIQDENADYSELQETCRYTLHTNKSHG